VRVDTLEPLYAPRLRTGSTRHLRAFSGSPVTLALLACVWLLAPVAAVRADEEDEEDEDAPQVQRFLISESSYDWWIFGYGETAHMVRVTVERELELLIDEVDRAGGLDAKQRARLRLAGRGDIERWFEEVDAARATFTSVRVSRDEYDVLQQGVEPLRDRLEQGLFSDESLFRKAVRTTVSPAHAARWGEFQEARKQARYRAKVSWVIAVLDNVMALSDEQRQALERFVLAETRLPRQFGRWDYYVILWQMSRLPEAKLRPLLSEHQWEVLNHQFTELTRDHMRRYIERAGLLPAEEEEQQQEQEQTDAGGAANDA
jgi:hypothetical protein